MTNQELTLSSAIKVAMEAERKAATLYGDAAQKTANPLGRRLFNRLAEFERHHYDKLVELQNSLREQGVFIKYEGKELSIPAPGEVDSIAAPNKMSMMKIITMAQDIELQAGARYTALARQTTDPSGQAMFERLAAEEQAHYRLLRDVYWNLNDRGVWAWAE